MKKKSMGLLGAKTLNESLEKEENLLKAAYQEAEKDQDRIEAISDWESL